MSGGLQCSDFIKRSDGRWSPVIGMVLGGVLFGAGVRILPGVVHDGVDVVKWLDDNC